MTNTEIFITTIIFILAVLSLIQPLIRPRKKLVCTNDKKPPLKAQLGRVLVMPEKIEGVSIGDKEELIRGIRKNDGEIIFNSSGVPSVLHFRKQNSYTELALRNKFVNVVACSFSEKEYYQMLSDNLTIFESAMKNVKNEGEN